MKFGKYGEYILCKDIDFYFIDKIISINKNTSSIYLNLCYWYEPNDDKIVKEKYSKCRFSFSHFDMVVFTSDNEEECLEKMKVLCDINKYNL